MRIAIPSDDEIKVAAHTGRCGGFVIYDVNDGHCEKVEYRSNKFTSHALQNPTVDKPAESNSAVEPGFGRGQGHGQGQGNGGCGHGSGGNGHGEGQGHGQHSHNALLQGIGDCQAMIALGMGPRLVNDLEGKGINVFFTRKRDIETVMNAFTSGDFVSHPGGSACKGHQH